MYLKEFFSRVSSCNLQNITKHKKITSQQGLPLDEMFLMESCVFLRMSVCNLLAYKDLMCSNYLALATTTRYYSIFYAMNGLLRLIGKATIHPSDNDKTVPFQLTRNRKTHSYTVETAKGHEHEKLFNNFLNSFPTLITQGTSEYIRNERIDWNYDPFFMAQSMNSYALDEAKICCEYNFIDENFGNTPTLESAEYLEGIRVDYGGGEVYAWELIKYGLRILKNLEKGSNFKNDYNNYFWSVLIKSINKVRSREETKIVIKSFIKSL